MLFNKFFFRLSIRALVATIAYSRTKLCDVAQMANFGDILHPVFSANRMQHVLDLHAKFALRPIGVNPAGDTGDVSPPRKLDCGGR